MDYLVKSTKWTKHNGHTTWWGPNRSGYASMIIEAGIYSKEEAKHLEEMHGNDVCIAVPFDEKLVKQGIKQLEEIVKDSTNQIECYNSYIKREESHIENTKRKIQKLKERIK